jgi:hypothetical protein
MEIDASLSGLGLLLFHVLASGEEVPVASAVVDVRHLGFGVDASFQNNVTPRDGPTTEDHCVRLRNLTCYFQEDTGIVPMFGGEHLWQYVRGDNFKIRRNVLSCSFLYLTTKAETRHTS